MAIQPDGNGRFHDDDGRFVSLRAYVERIFDEREKADSFARTTLDRALNEAKETNEQARAEAKATVEKALIDAKDAADKVNLVMQKRLEILESGGAPFASRLDDSFSGLKTDVDALKVDKVERTVLDALRKKGEEEQAAQKKQMKYIVVAAGFSLAVSLIMAGIQLLN